MKQSDIQRLADIEKRVMEIARENGLLTTDIIFELVSPQRMIEAMAYHFPTNYSHWSFGRDYEKQRTIYDHSGHGIPYEVVWNFDNPRAFLVDTNPFALNALIMCHVVGHVDFFLGSKVLQKRKAVTDIAQEARNAARRFDEYGKRFGFERVEKVIDAANSIQWLQDPDPYADDIDEEAMRTYLMETAQAELENTGRTGLFKKELSVADRKKIESRLRRIKYKTPPVPMHDVLQYIIEHSPKPLRDWQKDILEVIRTQARYLAPQMRTKLLNEGWATYWHTRIMRQLFEEGYLTDEEHDTYSTFHRQVLRENKKSINWYRIGLALYEYAEDRWNKGQFGREYEDSKDIHKRSTWDTNAMKGREKIFEIRTLYTDRLAIENLFTDEFIRQEELYVWGELEHPYTGEIIEIILENNPDVIRGILRNRYTSYGIPQIAVYNGNYNSRDELYLFHEFTGFELNPRFEAGALENIHYLWGKPVHLETVEAEIDEFGEIIDKIPVLHYYDGEEHVLKVDGKQEDLEDYFL